MLGCVGCAARYRRFMVSAIGRLLDELSWEGNARKYRDGGRGLENVLTAEVFQALDFLPREAFLGRVLRGAVTVPDYLTEDCLENAGAHVEEAHVDVLPGDLALPDLGVRAQPDVAIGSSASYVFVEAKRVRRASFQPEQLARELLLTAGHGEGRQPVLLLVLGEPPPVTVKGHGRMSLSDAVALGLETIEARVGASVRTRVGGTALAYLTWSAIASNIEDALDSYDNPDRSTTEAVRRLGLTLTDAVTSHS